MRLAEHMVYRDFCKNKHILQIVVRMLLFPVRLIVSENGGGIHCCYQVGTVKELNCFSQCQLLKLFLRFYTVKE